MKKSYLIILAFLFCLNTNFSLAQESFKDQGLAAIQNENWTEALSLFTKHLSTNPDDATSWYYKGFLQIKTKDYKSAIPNLEKAKAKGYTPVFVADFNLAKCHAHLGDKEKALAAIEAAGNNGFSYIKRLEDEEFKALQSDPKFKEIKENIVSNLYPCMKSDKARRFDFWIGEWDVFANGRKVGDSEITMAKGGCAIHESYTTAGAYAGQSINYYDPVDKKWKQNWVGSSGDVGIYVETDKYEGSIQFLAKVMNGKGEMLLRRMTFTYNEDDTVRQYIEDSADDGKSWKASFDGIYKRKKTE